jgi:hypothetical protein
VLAEAGADHGDVLKKPPPNVLFKKIGTATLDFDLICVVGDVDQVGRVTSDLNYVIHKRLAELEKPAAAAELTVKGLEGIEQSLGSIATAVAGERKVPPRSAAGKVKASRSRAANDAVMEEAEEAVPAKNGSAPDAGKDEAGGKDDNKE